MKKMTKMLSVVIALLLCAAIFAACSPAPAASSEAAPTEAASSEAAPASAEATPAAASAEASAAAAEFNPADYPVAIAMDNKNHPVHRMVQLGFLKAAKELGYTNAQVIGTEGSDANEVYTAVDTFAAQGGKGLMLWRGDDTCFPTLKKMEAAGVNVGIAHFKFVKEDGTLPEGLDFNMACDPAKYGAAVADFMAEKLKGKTGTIAVTQNTKNNTENAAAEGFAARMKELNLEGITVLAPELEGSDATQAANVNAAIIQKNTDLIGAFSTTGGGSASWSTAAQKAGKSDDDLVLVAMDITEENLGYLNDGKIDALVYQPLYEEAFKTMEYLDKLLRGEEVPVWTDLEAPLVYVGGKDASDPATYQSYIDEVKTWFEQ